MSYQPAWTAIVSLAPPVLMGNPSPPLDFPRGSVLKNPPANAGDTGLIPGSRRSPGEGNGNPLQYSCLEIPGTEEPGGLMEFTGLQKSQTQLSDFTFTFMLDLRKGLLRSKADTIQERKGKRGKE